MKKILALSLLAVSIVAPSTFGQGYFLFTTGKSQAYDGFTTAGASAVSANVKVAFLWAPSGTATPMPANSTSITDNSATSASWTVAQAWSAINSGSDAWTLALNSVGGAAIANTAANGGVSYNGGAGFGVTGTTGGAVYSLLMISWNGAYADPTAAALAGSAVGWGSVFQYTAATASNDPTISNMAAKTPNFGTFIPAASVPEPTTIALAGLGGLALLALRRKK